MSVRVDNEKRKKLKAIASLQGKTMSGIVEDLIDQYIQKYRDEKKEEGEFNELMKVSEPSFSEWDNEEDEVYNDL
jgi:predicted transcriptional regulator